MTLYGKGLQCRPIILLMFSGLDLGLGGEDVITFASESTDAIFFKEIQGKKRDIIITRHPI